MSASVRFEDEIAGDDHADREAWPDRQRRRDVELAPNDLLTSIIDRVLAAIADGAQEPVLVINGKLGPD
jgi:hypothetical protein